MRQRTKEQMYPLVETWQSSNQSKSSFCREQQVNIHTFNYWLQKYKTEFDEGTSSAVGEKFVALRLSSDPVSESLPKLEISYPNGVSLRLGEVVSLAYLEALIKLRV